MRSKNIVLFVYQKVTEVKIGTNTHRIHCKFLAVSITGPCCCAPIGHDDVGNAAPTQTI